MEINKIYFCEANLTKPSLYTYARSGLKPATKTYNLISNFLPSIKYGWLIYDWTITRRCLGMSDQPRTNFTPIPRADAGYYNKSSKIRNS